MKQQRVRVGQIAIFSCILLASAGAFAESAVPASSNAVATPSSFFVYPVLLLILFGSLLSLLVIRNALSGSNWSLADAISEECELTAMLPPDANGISNPMLDNEGKPVLVTQLRASSSRLVALMGMIILLLIFTGFGIFSLYYFAKTGNMPGDIDKAVNFLLAGLTLFAPYAINKFSNVFESLSPKKV